jgi:hypothetical protein
VKENATMNTSPKPPTNTRRTSLNERIVTPSYPSSAQLTMHVGTDGVQPAKGLSRGGDDAPRHLSTMSRDITGRARRDSNPQPPGP